MAEVWLVFAVRGMKIIEPTTYTDEDWAKKHYDRLCERMQRVDMNGDQDPGWSVHKLKAKGPFPINP